MEINQKILRELFLYSPESGLFINILRRSGSTYGAIAGTLNVDGYRVITINNKRYPEHRLAWIYMTGENPKSQIDHINGNRSDNRFCNIREATPFENQQNRSIPKNNTSGFVGVRFNLKVKKWSASICISGNSKHIGYFSDLDKAISARADYKRKIHTFNPTIRMQK